MQDFEAAHEYACDPEVCRYLVYGPDTPKETRQFLQMAITESHKNPCTRFHLAVVEQQTDRLIGACSLEIVSERNQTADLGYCLNKTQWNRGYATECARALVAYGFQELGLHRIEATCRPANAASAKVLQKVGMQKEGHLRHHKLIRGKWEDSLLYAILAEEWGAGLSR